MFLFIFLWNFDQKITKVENLEMKVNLMDINFGLMILVIKKEDLYDICFKTLKLSFPIIQEL